MPKKVPLYYRNKVWAVLKKIMGQYRYEMFRSKRMLGYTPNMDAPDTFNDKIIYRKLYAMPPTAPVLSDKYAVRDFVADKIGTNYLTKLYYVGESPDDIPFDTLPDKFIVKTNHGAGGNFIVKGKSSADFDAIRAGLHKYLREDFGSLTNETWYSHIPPKVIIEELLEIDDQDDLPDYKFYCFDGKCHFIQVITDRFIERKLTFYDQDWVLQPFGLNWGPRGDVPKPDCFEEMKKIAEKLSEGFDFVRVDLYDVNGKVYFGEMTFAPNAGWEPIVPVGHGYDKMLGAPWHLKLSDSGGH